MTGLRICVTGGYRIMLDGDSGGPYQAEAIVYRPGGITEARFLHQESETRSRAVVTYRAEQYLAASEEERAKMRESEKRTSSTRQWRWLNWWGQTV